MREFILEYCDKDIQFKHRMCQYVFQRLNQRRRKKLHFTGGVPCPQIKSKKVRKKQGLFYAFPQIYPKFQFVPTPFHFNQASNGYQLLVILLHPNPAGFLIPSVIDYLGVSIKMHLVFYIFFTRSILTNFSNFLDLNRILNSWKMEILLQIYENYLVNNKMYFQKSKLSQKRGNVRVHISHGNIKQCLMPPVLYT